MATVERTDWIEVPMTEQERQAIERAAAAARMSVEDWARELVLDFAQKANGRPV